MKTIWVVVKFGTRLPEEKQMFQTHWHPPCKENSICYVSFVQCATFAFSKGCWKLVCKTHCCDYYWS